MLVQTAARDCWPSQEVNRPCPKSSKKSSVLGQPLSPLPSLSSLDLHGYYNQKGEGQVLHGNSTLVVRKETRPWAPSDRVGLLKLWTGLEWQWQSDLCLILSRNKDFTLYVPCHASCSGILIVRTLFRSQSFSIWLINYAIRLPTPVKMEQPNFLLVFPLTT